MAFGRIELLKKIAGKRVQISTRCGTFHDEQGHIKDVFDDFFVFLTAGSSGAINQRNMIMFENIGVIRQLPEVETDEIQIVR